MEKTKRYYLKIDLLGPEIRRMLDEMVAEDRKEKEMNTSVLIRSLIRIEYSRRAANKDYRRAVLLGTMLDLESPTIPRGDPGNDG